jgi:hypothetical protein
MDTVTVKVHEYNEENHSIIVSFTTDASDQSVDESERFSFDIHNYNPEDMADTLQQIARQGARIAHQRWLREQALKKQEVVDAARAEVGKVYNFPIADLIEIKTYSPPSGDNNTTADVTIL